jgi:predicted NBD/HSP70 family sugar kinase
MKGPLNARRIFAEARRDDEIARKVVATEARWIAFIIAAVGPVVDPELVVLGGGIGRNGDLLLEPIERELKALSPLHPRGDVCPHPAKTRPFSAPSPSRFSQLRIACFARAEGRGRIVV